jgi:hypothetical protein
MNDVCSLKPSSFAYISSHTCAHQDYFTRVCIYLVKGTPKQQVGAIAVAPLGKRTGSRVCRVRGIGNDFSAAFSLHRGVDQWIDKQASQYKDKDYQ